MPVATTDNVTRPLAMGYQLALDERLFRLAVSPQRQLTIETAPLQAPRINTTSSAEEASAEFGLIFARSSFDGGEGLFRAHVEGAAPNRFWDSRGIDVSAPEPGEFPQMRLLHDVVVSEPSANSDLRMAYDVLGGSLYVTDGTILRRTDDPESAAATWVDDDPAAAEVLTQVHDVAVLGTDVFVALGAQGIHRKQAGTWTHYSDVLATRIWAVKGRLLASDGEDLFEVVASGAAPTATLELDAGFGLTDATDGGSHVLVGADDGYVYAYSTESGTLALTAQTLFENEQVEAVGQTQGVVGIGTRQGNVGRFYVGALDGNGQIVDLQVVKTWGTKDSATAEYPHRILGTRAALYVGVTDGTDSGLWRYDLVTGGMVRHLTADGVAGQINGIEVARSRLYFAVDATGVIAEADTYVAEGYLIGPLGDFYSASAKSWVGARLETADMAATGGTVELFYSLDPEALADDSDAAWTRVVQRTTGSGDPGEHVLSNVVGRQLAGMVKLYPPAGSSATPAVRSFSFRAYPSSGDEDVIVTLPVNVSDQIERRGRARVKVPGRGAAEFASLRLLEGRPTTMELFRPELMVRGLVEKVSTPVPVITGRGSVTWVSEVVVRGREISSVGTTTGIGTFGTYHLFGTTPTFGSLT